MTRQNTCDYCGRYAWYRNPLCGFAHAYAILPDMYNPFANGRNFYNPFALPEESLLYV